MIKDELKKLIEECEQIRGHWNGKDSGYAEDQANIASDIIEKSKELIELINELNGTN
jgi:hypothetical protein